MSEVRGDEGKYVRRTRACRSQESLRSTQEPCAGKADSTGKKSFQGDGLKSEKTDFEGCVGAAGVPLFSRDIAVAHRIQLDAIIFEGKRSSLREDAGLGKRECPKTAQRGRIALEDQEHYILPISTHILWLAGPSGGTSWATGCSQA